MISPNELRALQKIEKDVGAKIITQEIPTKDALVDSQQDQLITQILEAKENESANEIIKKLTSSLDVTAIAYKLLSLLQAQNKVMGKNVIGMNLREIEDLIKRKANERPSGGGGRNRRGGGRNRSRNGSGGNRSGGGSREGGGSRDGNRSRNRSRNRD